MQVTGNTSSIIRYDWTFGPGASLGSTSTTSAQLPVSWKIRSGTKVITVTAIQATGPSGDGLASVTVRSEG